MSDDTSAPWTARAAWAFVAQSRHRQRLGRDDLYMYVLGLILVAAGAVSLARGSRIPLSHSMAGAPGLRWAVLQTAIAAGTGFAAWLCGPITLCGGATWWLAASPLDRRALLGRAFRRLVSILVAVGLSLSMCVWALTGLSPWLAASLSCAPMLGLLLALRQAGLGWARLAAIYGTATVLPVVVTFFWAPAGTVAAALLAGVAGVLAQHSLGQISRFTLVTGQAQSSAAAGAVLGGDTALLLDIVQAHVRITGPTRIRLRGAGRRALASMDIRRSWGRTPLAYLLVLAAVGAGLPFGARIGGLITLVGSVLGYVLLLATFRRLVLSAGLRRLLPRQPFGLLAVCAAAVLTCAIATLVSTMLWVVLEHIGWAAAALMATATHLAALLAALRFATADRPNFSSSFITAAGAVPVAGMITMVRGYDIILACTIAALNGYSLAQLAPGVVVLLLLQLRQLQRRRLL